MYIPAKYITLKSGTQTIIKYREKSTLAHLVTMLLIAVAAACLFGGVNAQEATNEKLAINLKNADIHSLIQTVSLRTGKNFIVDPRVAAKVTVISAEPINANKLYQLFLSVLDVHGFAAVETGNFIKIVPSSVGVQNAVPVVRAEQNVNDQLVTRVIPVQNVPAVQMVETLRPLLPQTAKLSAEPSSNSLVVTDSAANIERLTQIIQQLEQK